MTTSRSAEIDAARGLAIIAIVLGHVLRGLVAGGLIDPAEEWAATLDRGLYLVHLSVFALLAGLFVPHAVDRDGVAAYLRQRDVAFVYLYLLWSLLQGGIKLATASLVNSPTSALEVLELWIPEGQLWFLPLLVLLTTLVAPLRPWRDARRAVPVAVVATAVSLAAWGLGGTVAGSQGWGLAIFFVAGVLLGARRYVALLAGIPRVVALTGAVAALTAFVVLVATTPATPPTSGGETRTVLSVGLGAVTSIVGVVAVALLAHVLGAVRATGWLARIGARSLEIFLAHICAAAGVRILLVLAGVDAAAIHLLAGTVAGVGLPLLLATLAERLRFPWLFAAPRVLTHGVASRRPTAERMSGADAATPRRRGR